MKRRWELPPFDANQLPKPAVYYEVRPFQPNIPLPAARINTAHLLREAKPDEMLQRLPPTWSQKLRYTSLKDQPSLLLEIHQRCRRAIEVAMEMACEDPDIVATQYCRGKDEMQYLLPINLTAPQECATNPECVVTLRITTVRLRSQVVACYEVNTLLPLDIAIGNARLVQFPKQKWLQSQDDDSVVDLCLFKARRM